MRKNKNVLRFREKHITYTAKFKIKAVEQYLNKGMSAREIFILAGFDLNIIGPDKPGYLMHDWLKVFREKGSVGLTKELRGKGGGRRKTALNGLTPKEKIKRLELEVQYLKKENDFLAKLRAKRTE